ncbi:PqiC family protein [Halomonas getboli]|uniref:PqiC family protein n=1 Tax=Halomonas getboli TaxID=2935862 RepID=UPI001FFFCFA5|nr:ABC-type transport auxiliary lipoprotein family protein [Halomonas getboli]MCK2183301.1 ABC-type transport auxiliary lipoprotein family protein [Halomonas getboli]
MIVSRALLPLAALLWLTGCALDGAPATRYALPDVDASAGSEAAAEHSLVLRPLRLAPLLDTQGIVVQLDDITLREASGHRWAEPLGRQLERGLRERLAAALPDTRVLLDGEAGGADEPLQLRVNVERFQGQPDGRAVAAGRWQLLDADQVLLDAAGFRVATPLAEDGYPALVRALGRSWDGVAERIAAAVARQQRRVTP